MVAIAPAIILVLLLMEYGIDRAESEMTCHYSNSRAPGDGCEGSETYSQRLYTHL